MNSNSKKNTNQQILIFWLMPMTITAASFLIIFWSIAMSADMPFVEFCAQLVENLYLPNKNSFQALDVAGIPTYLILYLCTLLSLFLVFLASLFLQQKGLLNKNERPLTLVIICFVSWCLITTLQTKKHVDQFNQYNRNILRLSTNEKIDLHLKNTHRYSLYAQSLLKGPHRCEAVSDLDIKKSSHMRTFGAMAYYLYPINIRLNNNAPVDCQAIFVKKNPYQSVKEGYKALAPYDQQSLITVKEL